MCICPCHIELQDVQDQVYPHTMVSPRKRLQKPLSQFFDDFSVPCVAIQNINVIGIGLYRAILIDNEIIRPHIGPLI